VSKSQVLVCLKPDFADILEGPIEIVVKNGNNLTILPATTLNITKNLHFLPQNARYALYLLSDEDVKKQYSSTKKDIAKKASGSRAQFLIHEKMSDYFCSALLQIEVHTTAHMRLQCTGINPSNGNLMRMPCIISDECFINEIHVHVNEQGTCIVTTYMQIGEDEVVNLEEFYFKHFVFIQKEQYLFLLSASDRKALQLAYGSKAKSLCDNVQDFTEYVVQELQRTHTVIQFNEHQAEVESYELTCAIQLSELGDQYLIITPKFLYDGIVFNESEETISTGTRNGQTVHIERNKIAEQEFIAYIKNQHPKFARKTGDYILTFAEAKNKNWFLHFYRELVSKNCEVLGMDLMTHFRFNPNVISTKLSPTRTFDAYVELSCIISFGEIQVPLKELQKQLQQQARTILLEDNSLGVISEDWYIQYGTIVKHARLLDDNLIEVAQWILMQAGAELEKLVNIAMPHAKAWQAQWQTWQQDDEVLYEVPSTINASLRPYQQKGFEWLALLNSIQTGALLADDMGLGKTLQTITYLGWLKQKYGQLKVLIVCPASLTYNWHSELVKFAPSITTTIFSEVDNNMQTFVASDNEVLITSYAMMRNRITDLSAFNWLGIILDESHNIKNPSTQVTQAALQLRAPHKVAISGTPILNSTVDLYTQFKFLVPELLGEPAFFKKNYAIPIEDHKSEWHAKELQRITSPFILRRTKEQVAKDLPEKTVSVRYCEMTENQAAYYNKVKNDVKSNLFLQINDEGLNKAKLGVLQGIMKLRQICSTPIDLNYEGEQCAESAKINDVVEEVCNKTGQHKVLIFSQYMATLNQLEQEFTNKKIAYLRIDGSVKSKDRAELNKEFETSEDVRVFLLSTTAASQGLNLVSADHVYLIEPWWNTAIENQAIDRSHRIGQNKPVFAYKMICKNTIEEKLLEIQNRKVSVSDDLVQAEEGFVKSLSMEEVKWLFD
jgi:superfamily II DNA or RNA helicase